MSNEFPTPTKYGPPKCFDTMRNWKKHAKNIRYLLFMQFIWNENIFSWLWRRRVIHFICVHVYVFISFQYCAVAFRCKRNIQHICKVHMLDPHESTEKNRLLPKIAQKFPHSEWNIDVNYLSKCSSFERAQQTWKERWRRLGKNNTDRQF